MNSYKKTVSQARSLKVWSDSGLQSLIFFFALISVIIVLLSWPDKLLYKFVINGEIPKTYSIVSISTVLLISIVSAIFGRTEARKTLDELAQITKTNETSKESNSWLFVIQFFQFVIQSILLLGLFFPMLLPGIAISRLSWGDLAKTTAIIYSTVLLFRVFGYSVYLFLSKRDFLDTLITGLFFLSFFLFSAIWLDFINPLVLIYHLNLGQEVNAPMLMNAFTTFQLVLYGLVFLLTLVCFLKIRFKFRSK